MTAIISDNGNTAINQLSNNSIEWATKSDTVPDGKVHTEAASLSQQKIHYLVQLPVPQIKATPEMYKATGENIQAASGSLSAITEILLLLKKALEEQWDLQMSTREVMTQLTVASLNSQAEKLKDSAGKGLALALVGAAIGLGMSAFSLYTLRKANPSMKQMSEAQDELKNLNATKSSYQDQLNRPGAPAQFRENYSRWLSNTNRSIDQQKEVMSMASNKIQTFTSSARSFDQFGMSAGSAFSAGESFVQTNVQAEVKKDEADIERTRSDKQRNDMFAGSFDKLAQEFLQTLSQILRNNNETNRAVTHA